MLSYLYRFQRILDIKGGEHLFYPNKKVPFLLLPLHSKEIFFKALEILNFLPLRIKLYKKLRKILKFIPLSLCGEKGTLTLSTEGNYYAIIILPFSIHKKMVFILFKNKEIFVRKVAFGKSKNLLHNEYKAMTSPLISRITPKVIQHREYNNLALLDIEFIKGNFIRDRKLPKQITDFFRELYTEYSQGSFYPFEHPYILHMLNLVESKLKLLKNKDILENWFLFKNRIMNIDKKYLLTAMHGDFTATNVIENTDIKILDWEYFSTEGINIDLTYFYFRQVLDSRFLILKHKIAKFHPIETLYHLYFQVKNLNYVNENILKTIKDDP